MPKLPNFVAGLVRAAACAEQHDVIWLVLLSTALVTFWGSSDDWNLAALRRRLGHALHPDQRAQDAERHR